MSHSLLCVGFLGRLNNVCDTDVALMVARYAGAGLGLLAFTVTILGGLIVRNPVSVVLSRSILALFVFCLIGIVLGTFARWIINEHEQSQVLRIKEKYQEDPAAVAPVDKESATPTTNASDET